MSLGGGAAGAADLLSLLAGIQDGTVGGFGARLDARLDAAAGAALRGGVGSGVAVLGGGGRRHAAIAV